MFVDHLDVLSLSSFPPCPALYSFLYKSRLASVVTCMLLAHADRCIERGAESRGHGIQTTRVYDGGYFVQLGV